HTSLLHPPPLPAALPISSTITSPALRSVLRHCVSSALSAGRPRSGVGGRVTPLVTPPAVSSVTTAANSSRLSRSCLKASPLPCEDRKSTRLNSSHVKISY